MLIRQHGWWTRLFNRGQIGTRRLSRLCCLWRRISVHLKNFCVNARNRSIRQQGNFIALIRSFFGNCLPKVQTATLNSGVASIISLLPQPIRWEICRPRFPQLVILRKPGDRGFPT